MVSIRLRRPAAARTARLALRAALALLAAGAGAAAEARAADRPNIVVILTDDLDDTTSTYWERADAAGLDDPLKRTRALLKDQGMTFANSFAPTPICCPARSTILTGLYGHNTGVLTNGGPYGGWQTFAANGNEERSVAVWLDDAGYRTSWVGKYMNGIDAAPWHIPPGWDDWAVFVDVFFHYVGYLQTVNDNGLLVRHGIAPEDYTTDLVRDRALRFLDEALADEGTPFFAVVAPTAPHLPIPPAPRHAANPYVDAEAPQPLNYREADLTDKPGWLRASGAVRAATVDAWNPVDYRLRMGSLYAVDELVEAIVGRLEEAGALGNTYVVFTSDNGYNLGAHRLIHKMAPYEESLRVPLVVRGPGVPAGAVEERMVLQIDYAPTFTALAGASPNAEVDGVSFVPLLDGAPPADWRRDFLVQYKSGGAANGIGAELPPALLWLIGQDLPSYRALRTEDMVYIDWEDGIVRFEELYDLRADPYQLDNLLDGVLGRILYDPLRKEMRARTAELADCAGPTCRD